MAEHAYLAAKSLAFHDFLFGLFSLWNTKDNRATFYLEFPWILYFSKAILIQELNF